MFKPRPKEPAYAFVPNVAHPEANRYGQPIETVPAGDARRGQLLNINGDTAIGANPNRYKQHGFFFTADNCIACHACEAACSEKNNLPPHIAFRSVGYVEGGSWPSYQRLNISMACNHCDDPVCLKGCPTRAYTKFAEYGAVLQDPDICFGCGYCTWVCPYNAPQLDTQAGHVSKCNMCVDRLEVGLKPACVAACLAGALDFGVIETKPDNRVQAETRIPGFPSPDISHPNIRFQQVKSLPRELTRPDSMPIKYIRDAHGRVSAAGGMMPGAAYVQAEQGAGGLHRPAVDDDGRARGWGLKKLSTRENPLVVFTLISQAVVGAFALLFLAPLFGVELLTAAKHPAAYPALLFALIGLETFALVLSTLHLGRPHRFYRAFNNLRWSPVSREVAGIAVFYNLLGAYALLTSIPMIAIWVPAAAVVTLVQAIGWVTVIAGVLALWFMHRIYRIPARPFWNHRQVLTSFYGNMLVLGALTLATVLTMVGLFSGTGFAGVSLYLVAPLLAGLALEAIGLWFHARSLRQQGGEGAASHYEQTTTFGYTYQVRNTVLGLTLVAVSALFVATPTGTIGLVAWSLTALAVIAAAVVGRMLFYALVIPTTMPGAFFWRNRGFEEHARATGLAAMPQVGVVKP
ncbi:MAG: aspartate carbamoyltransferase [Candidatus Muproteobacteria bacterium RBG_16_62_13]|uniref:Aspartate carbamoyltransferase n=1 Tax=Candidatus Muproteobacteria bacterium RBG_16_62_13 TaxID=1817756 RepID=A0A1F6SYK0_9PROT|nr:MAG: aspartate carbamoyltransferase [Candidatus Muproteobacteria bacterium RBG_16_62_13]